MAIAGSGLGPAAQAVGAPDPTTGNLDGILGGVIVSFDGNPAPLVNASATLITAVVPYEVAGETSTQMTVSFNGQVSAVTTLPVAPSFPGLFSADSSGAGQAMAVNGDLTGNSDSNPANLGDTITLFGTGEGQTDPPGVDGQYNNGATMPQPVLPVSVTIGGQTAPVVAYGGQTGQVAGYFQVSVTVPSGLAAGDQPVALTVGSASSQPGLTVGGERESVVPKQSEEAASGRPVTGSSY